MAGILSWKNWIFCFFVNLEKGLCRATHSVVQSWGESAPEKFLFVEKSGEIPKNSGTDVSTPLLTIELSDFFHQKNVFGPVLVCA